MRLRVLLLSHNAMVSLQRGDICSSLEVLDASHNYIKRVNSYTFGHVPGLRFVNLTYNELSSFGKEDMAILHTLVSLHLISTLS